MSFSLDEEYLACFLDCVLAGSTESEQLRPTTRRTFTHNPALLRRIADARVVAYSGVSFLPEVHRVENVLTKFARGIAAYELSEPQFEAPTLIDFAPLNTLTPQALETFESIDVGDANTVWPEMGSRAFQRVAFLFSGSRLDVVPDLWIDVQPGNFRYYAFGGPDVEVRMVLREYLAVKIVWSP